MPNFLKKKSTENVSPIIPATLPSCATDQAPIFYLHSLALCNPPLM